MVMKLVAPVDPGNRPYLETLADRWLAQWQREKGWMFDETQDEWVVEIMAKFAGDVMAHSALMLPSVKTPDAAES